MKYTEPGTYKIQYAAEDGCGKTTVEDRTVIVAPPPRTVLYTDGTLIINESGFDIDKNMALHGQVLKTYPALDNDHDYHFGSGGSYWKEDRNSILGVEIGSSISPTWMKDWFSELTSLKTVDLLKVDYSNVERMDNMFASCSTLESVDISNINAPLLDACGNMFANCSSLKTVDMSGWSTSKAISFASCFIGCKALETVDMLGNSTIAVSNIINMFSGCIALQSVSLRGFDTSAVQSLYNTFRGCGSLQTVDLGGVDTSNVTTMESMFYKCNALTSLDLSGFNTLNTVNMKQMLNFCSSLQIIYASPNFVTSQVTNSDSMFSAMSNALIGGAGTVWNRNNPTDKTYARIDGGTSNPGYFTLKED